MTTTSERFIHGTIGPHGGDCGAVKQPEDESKFVVLVGKFKVIGTSRNLEDNLRSNDDPKRLVDIPTKTLRFGIRVLRNILIRPPNPEDSIDMLRRMATPAQFKRLIRFVPRSDSSKVLIGQPTDDKIDVGVAIRNGQDVSVDIFSGSSVLSPGQQTGVNAIIDRVLSPLSATEVGTIRCIGLNYKQHAAEVNMSLPTVPTVFMKPNTSLGDPWPAPTVLPKITQEDDCGDYESELAIVIGKTAKNVPEAEALDYILGYTAANDISSRTSQFAQSQWSYSKGFDGACPIGPTLVSPSLIPDASQLHIRGLKNGDVLQDCGIDDLIFSIPKLISFLSQGTTLPAGTLIITGTPAGVGIVRKPKVTIQGGDEFAVEILPHIGTLFNVFENEK